MTALHIVHIGVQEKSLTPTLLFKVQFSYTYSREALLSISGELLAADGTLIGYIFEGSKSDERAMYLVPYGDQLEKNSAPPEYQMQTTLACPLSHAAIECIENQRALHPQKKVQLFLKFRLRRMDMPGHMLNTKELALRNPQVSINIDRFELQHEIEHSAWINQFAEQLGVGDFVLLELGIPDLQVPERWQVIFATLRKRVEEMRTAMQRHDWKSVLIAARQFFENLKFDERHPERLALKEELKATFLRQQHSPEAFDAWYQGIWYFFDYASKFIHDLDRRGNNMPEPLADRNDAQLVYGLGIALLNLLYSKLRA